MRNYVKKEKRKNNANNHETKIFLQLLFTILYYNNDFSNVRPYFINITFSLQHNRLLFFLYIAMYYIYYYYSPVIFICRL